MLFCCLFVPVQHPSPLLLIKVSGADGLTSVPALSKEKNESCLTHQCYPSPLATVIGLGTSMCEYLCSVANNSFMVLWTVAHQAPLSMDSPGKATRVGCHFLLQGIFPNHYTPREFPKRTEVFFFKQIFYSLLFYLSIFGGSGSSLLYVGCLQLW